MSGWLSDIVAGYLNGVTEREFDATFTAILRGAGFTQIHRTHGSYEFGKDFIAKRDGEQWVFQTKAGDVNLSDWRIIRPQIEEMLSNDIAHPSFEARLARRPVLVTTGRLTGGAPADAQQFKADLARRRSSRRGRLRARILGRQPRPIFDVWDQDELIGRISGLSELSLNVWGETPLREFLGLLADIEREGVSARVIERSSRSWLEPGLSRACVAAAIVAARLRLLERLDLACTTAYALIRAGAAADHRESSDPEGEQAMGVGRSIFRIYAEELVDRVAPAVEDPKGLFNMNDGMAPTVTYPVRCLAVVETLGMLGLLYDVEGKQEEAAKIATLLAGFVRHQPGAAHPLSDRWAVSIIPAAVLLARYEPDAVSPWLEGIAVWVCDHYERAPGLASVKSSPSEEIAYLLGPPYEHVELNARNQSFLATVILDLASALELSDLYSDAFNDFAAVDIAFPVMEPSDEVGQYFHDGTGVVFEPNIPFEENPDFTRSWMTAEHHRRSTENFHLGRAGRSWELMAISLLLRDRHFLSVTRQLVQEPHPPGD